MNRSLPVLTNALIVASLLAACTEDGANVAAPAQDASAHLAALQVNNGAPAPAGQVAIEAFGRALTLWPYTGADLSGAPTDPINLVFNGAADPRDVRNALMGLDGNRTAFGFPGSAPFDCRWSDTPSGGIQATWTDASGWSGNAIQLQCGDYAPLRFHVRLFRAGDRSVGNAHFEVLIPGTTDHQVLSWELAEQLVTVDLLRSGLLESSAPMQPVAGINAAPSFKTIPAIIFNGLPPELQALATGAPGNVTADVPIPSDGTAMAFNLAVSAPIAAGVSRSFTLQFDQVIPKPFCGGPGDYLYVNGPVTLTESATISGTSYTTNFHAAGELTVVPINPLTGEPTGAPYQAVVQQNHQTGISNNGDHVRSHLQQRLLPIAAPGHGKLTAVIKVDSRGIAYASTVADCN